MLLSARAEADNKSELEILVEDVTCNHGATSGARDGNLVFRLRAGLSEKDAQMYRIKNLRECVTA
ncbi:SufD family Fe-S cluster assembly protein [Bradyrhizobium sp. Gha]|uniref:SufD family Fe-S cluster assembly protein n=1 Tax=Bradyrhizobium sp. Gha TaxID=1855318 RepID=UPI0008EDD922|nr:Fe-S cluster assembly protein SufD [Bradyrhizobium sp. Gha]